MSDDTTPAPKYVIFSGSSSSGSSGNGVLYNSVKVRNLRDGNPEEVFRVYSNQRETERLFRNGDGGNVQYIKLVRQPAMELATLPPPRNNVLYLVTEYEMIRNPLFTFLADRKLQIYTKPDTDFQSLQESLHRMMRMYDNALTTDKKQLERSIKVATDVSDVYVFHSITSDEVDIPTALQTVKSKTLKDLILNIKKKSPNWNIVIDLYGQLTPENFSMRDPKGITIQGTELSLGEKSSASEPALEPAPSQATEPSSTTASEPAPSQATEPSSTTASEPASTTASEPAPSQATEPSSTTASEPASTTASEPAASQATEPASTTASEPAASQATEPSSTTASEPAASQATEPSSTTASEPASTTASEPAASQATEPASTTASEPAASQATEPSSTTASEPAASQATEPSSTTATSNLRTQQGEST